ncbi:fluoride efflux transporter CrcB [Streptomyces sp. NPDC048512]|uniref:fluoride efflux transporter CrcB n=1 Tax=Streptomyces sp. NPDC048512 TaxID=3365563 RepID=UPI0037164DF8
MFSANMETEMSSSNPAHGVKEPMNCDFDALAHDEHRWRASGAAVVGVVAIGGVIGAEARYGASRLWPQGADEFPLTTVLVNVTGCALIGVVLAAVSHMRAPNRLLRPFLATGLLGGFTTFSTYAVETQKLIQQGHPVTALLNLGATMAGALAAVTLTSAGTRRLLARRRRPR